MFVRYLHRCVINNFVKKIYYKIFLNVLNFIHLYVLNNITLKLVYAKYVEWFLNVVTELISFICMRTIIIAAHIGI